MLTFWGLPNNIIAMGIIYSLFSFLSEASDDSYLLGCERWFDGVWKNLYRPNYAKGCLEIKEGRLYKKLLVSLRDNTRIVITDDNDEGRKLRYVSLNSEQKRQLLHNGFLTIKEYE